MKIPKELNLNIMCLYSLHQKKKIKAKAHEIHERSAAQIKSNRELSNEI